MVPGNAAGVQVIDVYDKLGHRGVMTPRVHFEEVRVPANHLIGRPGQGLEIVSGAFSWTAALIGAACVGVMRSAFEYALDFAKSEQRLGSVQVIEHLLCCSRTHSGTVKVFNTKNELTIFNACEEPGEQSGTQIAHMQYPCWTGGVATGNRDICYI